jgi:hypothetical protein
VEQRSFRARIHGGLKVRAQSGELRGICRAGDQCVAILILARQGADEVADVRSNAEIADVPGIDYDMQRHRCVLLIDKPAPSRSRLSN